MRRFSVARGCLTAHHCMKLTRTLTATSLLATVALLSLTGCGDDSTSTPSTPASDTVTAESTAAPDTSAFCAAVAAADAAQADLDAAMNAGTSDAATLQAKADAVRTAVGQAVASAPADLAADAASMQMMVQELLDAYAAAGYDMNALATTPEYIDFATKYQDPALQAPADRFGAAADELCA